jgi:hypothetical protein
MGDLVPNPQCNVRRKVAWSNAKTSFALVNSFGLESAILDFQAFPNNFPLYHFLARLDAGRLEGST